MRSIVILLVTAAVAIVAMLSAFSQSAQKIAPAMAAAAFPLNGNAAALLARISERSDQLANPQGNIAPSAVTLALASKAYLAEPRSFDAINTLARGSRKDASRDTMAILEVAHGLTRRSTGLQMELLAEVGKRNDEQAGFAIIDELLRRNTEAHGVLLGTLASAAAREELLPSFRRLLKSRPPWADQFWRQLAQSAPGLANAAQMRMQYARDGGIVDPEVDRMLVEGLAGQGLFDDAAMLARQVWPEKGLLSPQSAAVRNSGFAAAPDILPFDWRLTNTGDYGASIDPRGKTMMISAIAGARGPVVEQIVRLRGSEMTLIVTPGDGVPAKQLEPLSISLDCVAPAASSRTLFSGGVGDQAIAIQTGACTWARLRIDLAVPSTSDGMELSFDSIKLLPAGRSSGS